MWQPSTHYHSYTTRAFHRHPGLQPCLPRGPRVDYAIVRLEPQRIRIRSRGYKHCGLCSADAAYPADTGGERCFNYAAIGFSCDLPFIIYILTHSPRLPLFSSPISTQAKKSLLANTKVLIETTTPIYEKKSTDLNDFKDILIVHPNTSNPTHLHLALYKDVSPYQFPEGNKGHHNRSFATRG